jgi:histidine triad (HIT) family protein
MDSIFTRIINREIPGYIVDETDQYIAILARGQVQPGHTLVIPKQPIDKYTDMDPKAYGELQSYACEIAKLLIKTYPDKQRIIMNIVGFEVDHLHIHLIPANSEKESYQPGQILTDDEMNTILTLILGAK